MGSAGVAVGGTDVAVGKTGASVAKGIPIVARGTGSTVGARFPTTVGVRSGVRVTKGVLVVVAVGAIVAGAATWAPFLAAWQLRQSVAEVG